MLNLETLIVITMNSPGLLTIRMLYLLQVLIVEGAFFNRFNDMLMLFVYRDPPHCP